MLEVNLVVDDLKRGVKRGARANVSKNKNKGRRGKHGGPIEA